MPLIMDAATPMLQELFMVSRGYAMDALNHSSVKVREAMMAKARTYGTSKFGTDFSSGRRKLTGSNQGGRKGRYFSRFSKKDGKQEHGLDEFIKFQASSVSLKSMIGFINFKSFNAEIYREGRLVSKQFVKGQGRNPKERNGKTIKEIGQTMEFGGTRVLSAKQRRLYRASGWGAAANRGLIMRKARPIVKPTFASMSGKINGIIQEKYAKALIRHSANINQVRKIG